MGKKSHPSRIGAGMISLGFGRRWSVVCTVPRQRGEKGGPLRRRLCKKINIEGDPRPGRRKKKNGRNRREEISLIRARWSGLGVLSVARENDAARKRYRVKQIRRNCSEKEVSDRMARFTRRSATKGTRPTFLF